MTINVGILIIIGIRLPIVVHAVAINTAGALGIEREIGKEIEKEKEATMIDTTERAPEIETHIETEADIIVQDPEQKVQKIKKTSKKS